MYQMQFVQEACLTNLVVSAIFKSPNQSLFNFNWDLINNHSHSFTSEYNREDARMLLQLSLMTTEANYLETPLIPPASLETTDLIYNECPLPVIAQGFTHSRANRASNLGHILYNEQANTLFIIFTGTSNSCLAGLDLAYHQTELEGLTNYVGGMRGHRGIYLAYHSVRPVLVSTVKKYLPRKPKIIIAGHSLGGALSQLCALDLAYYDPIHYSFASPMIFNQMGHDAFSRFVKYSYRVANMSDLVVLSPLPVMPNNDVFLHVGNMIHFQRNLGAYSQNHAMAYAQEFNLVNNIAP